MTTDKVEEQEVVESPENEKEVEYTTKTYTEAEHVAQLEEARAAAAKEQFDKQNAKLSSQGAEIRRLREQVNQPQDGSQMAELTLAALKATQTSEYGDTNPAIAHLERQIRIEKAKEQQRTQNIRLDSVALEVREELEQDIREAGADPTNPHFENVFKKWEKEKSDSGLFERAYREANRAIKSYKLKGEGQMESEEEQLLRLQKKLRPNLYKTDTGATPAGNTGWKEAQEAYIKNPDNPKIRDTYLAMRREQGR